MGMSGPGKCRSIWGWLLSRELQVHQGVLEQMEFSLLLLGCQRGVIPYELFFYDTLMHDVLTPLTRGSSSVTQSKPQMAVHLDPRLTLHLCPDTMSHPSSSR